MAAKERSFIDSLWDFLCSLKLTLFTLIMLAVTSIIGTVILQKRTDAEYLQMYSEKVVRLFKALDFFDMYNSWWFILLLALMTVNLIACSINRFPSSWKLARKPMTTPTDGFMQALTTRSEFISRKYSPEQTANVLTSLLEKSNGKVQQTEVNGKIYLFNQKGWFSRFGAYVVHASIIVILLGAIMGVIWGQKAYVNIPQGGETTVAFDRDTRQPVELGFAVRCDDFTIDFYPNSRMPREYRSLLTVVDAGQEVPGYQKLPVIVNGPMTYKGWTFYQSSYGQAGDPMFRLTVKSRETGSEQTYELSENATAELPDGRGNFSIFRQPESTFRFGDGAGIRVQDSDGTGRPFVVFQRFPEFDEKRGGKYVFTLEEIFTPMYTGLEVAKDPGVPVVWLGCGLMIFGCFAAFFISHRRLWVVIESTGGKTGVILGGNSHRNQPGFELFFDELKHEFRTALDSPAGETEEV